MFVGPLLVSWVTISQVRFGAQVNHIREQTRGDYSSDMPPTSLLGYIWSMPSDPVSTEGLGGGITWAWDESLCDLLLPRFRERLILIPFVRCEQIKAAVHRGFNSWSDNHAHISFVDVTSECKAIDRLNRDCPLAELWVTALVSGASAGEDQGTSQDNRVALTPAELGVYGSISERNDASSRTAATATPIARYADDFRYTNGNLSAGGSRYPMVETHRAVLAFNVDESFCW